MGAPRIISLHSILGPPEHFLRLLYGAPHVSFFSYNMGAPLRSLSLFTIWGPPQISFFACYRGATSDFSFFHKIYGALLRSVSPLTIWSPLRLVSLLTSPPPPPRSLSSLTIWGHPQVSFFAYYMRALSQINFFAYYVGSTSDQILPILYGGGLRSVSSLTIGGPLRSVYSHTIWSPPQVDFFTCYMWGPP